MIANTPTTPFEKQLSSIVSEQVFRIDELETEIAKLKALMLRVADDVETKVEDGYEYGTSYMNLELAEDAIELRKAATEVE